MRSIVCFKELYSTESNSKRRRVYLEKAFLFGSFEIRQYSPQNKFQTQRTDAFWRHFVVQIIFYNNYYEQKTGLWLFI